MGRMVLRLASWLMRAGDVRVEWLEDQLPSGVLAKLLGAYFGTAEYGGPMFALRRSEGLASMLQTLYDLSRAHDGYLRGNLLPVAFVFWAEGPEGGHRERELSFCRA